MPWQAAMLLQNLFASFFAIESRALAKKYKRAHFQILAGTFAVLYAVFLAYALAHKDQINATIAWQYGGLILATSLLFAGWTVLTFITLRYVDAAIGTLYSVLNILAVAVVAWFTLGDSLSLYQLVGAVLLLLGVVIITHARMRKSTLRRIHFALVLTIIASILFGIAITSEKYLLTKIGMPTYAVFGEGMQFVILLILALVYNRNEFHRYKSPKFRNKVAFLGMVRGGAGLLFVLAIVGSQNASLIGMLSGFKIVLTAILAAIILRETSFISRKLIAACIACMGVGLMLW